MVSYWNLWAKTGSEGRWHALPCHLLDVAAVAEVLWVRLPAQARAVPCAAMDSQEMARRACVFLAAAHDIGKANRYFQAKVDHQYARLEQLVDLPPRHGDDDPRHGQATGAYLHIWLQDCWRWCQWPASTVALAVGGHHGVFPGNTDRSHLCVNCSPWAEIGQALLDDLAALLGVRNVRPRAPDPLNPFLGWLAGFVSVADWLGSHASMTVWQSEPLPLAEYLQQARRRAEAILDTLCWSTPPITPPLSVADLLPPGSAPNALQELAGGIAPNCTLAIVEAPTGEGKTEAAFALAERARSSGCGIYFALPTMATANGLHGRVGRYLRHATADADVQARLLHSQAWLFRDQSQTTPNPGSEGLEQDVQAQDWFAGAKRALLAPFGVGTIDQALIAALRAKHGFVRLFALAGKVVVIDEVHAYDVYMANILDVLLGWLRALGCRVILLSATLPRSRRAALLRAWGCTEAPADSRYPLLTWVDEQSRIQSQTFDVRPRKPLTFELLAPGAAPPCVAGAAKLLELVHARGGLGALVLNTVREAQEAFDWLSARPLGDVQLLLFHARFTAQDRQDIELQVLARFGRDGPRNAPAILVATQVVEQSLDLDFDHMVSAMAPIDLLIQRAGRLHRHPRRPDGALLHDGRDQRPDPVMHVIAPPAGDDGLPDLSDPVYSPDVLMRTLEWLRNNRAIRHPGDVADAVEAVYGENNWQAALEAWQRRIAEMEQKSAQKAQMQQRRAESATIKEVNDPDNLIVDADLDLDENDERQGSQLAAHTRLEDRPSITVALLHADDAGQLCTIHAGAVDNPRDVLFACVRISPPYPLWAALLELERLPQWRRKGPLSQVRQVELTHGMYRLGDYEIRYDARRGLDWRKIDANL